MEGEKLLDPSLVRLHLSMARIGRLWVGDKYIRVLHKIHNRGTSPSCGAKLQEGEVRGREVDAVCGVCWSRHTMIPRRVAHHYVPAEVIPELPRHGEFVFVPVELDLSPEHEERVYGRLAPPIPMGDEEVKALISRYLMATGDYKGAENLWEAHRKWREANGLPYIGGSR